MFHGVRNARNVFAIAVCLEESRTFHLVFVERAELDLFFARFKT